MMRGRKKKAPTKHSSSNNNTKRRKRLELDQEIVSSSDEEEEFLEKEQQPFQREDDDEHNEQENLEVKKVRMAREYLAKLQDVRDSSEEDDSSDDDENKETYHDTVSRRLQSNRLKREGAYEKDYADNIQTSIETLHQHISKQRPSILTPPQLAKTWLEHDLVSYLGKHDLTPTCLSLQHSGERVVSGSKDHSVYIWDVEQQTKLATLFPHWKKTDVDRNGGQVLSVAASDNGKYVAVGRKDATVSIFDVRGNNSLVKTFVGHKDGITSLAFRTQTLQLFSASADRCIRHYNLEEMIYLETLFGHQFGVMDIDCHTRERPISVGRDRTARGWKIAQDTHLIFRGGAKVPPADTVALVKDDWFVTGHQDGVVSLWYTEKKRAVASVADSHGTGKNGLGRGISSISSIKGSDVVATGSCDGYLRFWKAATGQSLDERGLTRLCDVPVHGFINGIGMHSKAKFCVVAVGQEHKYGRWDRVRGAKNRIALVKLDSEQSSSDDDQETE